MKIIILTLSASMLEAINWGNKIFLFLLKWQSVAFFFIRDLLLKALRLHFAIIKKEIRKNKHKPKQSTTKVIPKAPSIVIVNNIVGSSKTTFIKELPDRKEPEPIDTIELPLQKQEEPQELAFPESDEFDQETQGLTPEEMRQEMDAAFSNNNFDSDLPEGPSCGASVEDMAAAYNILHNHVPAETITEDVVANVIGCLSGTDMFKIFLNTKDSERMADEIMERHFQKFSSGKRDNEPSNFNISNFVE